MEIVHIEGGGIICNKCGNHNALLDTIVFVAQKHQMKFWCRDCGFVVFADGHTMVHKRIKEPGKMELTEYVEVSRYVMNNLGRPRGCKWTIITGIGHFHNTYGLDDAYEILDNERERYPNQEVVLYGVVEHNGRETILELDPDDWNN